MATHSSHSVQSGIPHESEHFGRAVRRLEFTFSYCRKWGGETSQISDLGDSCFIIKKLKSINCYKRASQVQSRSGGGVAKYRRQPTTISRQLIGSRRLISSQAGRSQPNHLKKYLEDTDESTGQFALPCWNWNNGLGIDMNRAVHRAVLFPFFRIVCFSGVHTVDDMFLVLFSYKWHGTVCHSSLVPHYFVPGTGLFNRGA